MRILGIGNYMSLGEMYRRLGLAGHQVRAHVSEPEAHQIFAGIVERCETIGAGLDWLREVDFSESLIIVETASCGDWQEQLRREGFRVIGSSAWGDRLENDRAFGQSVLRDAGLLTAPVHAFTDFDVAEAFIRRHPADWVYKPSGPFVASVDTYVGELGDGLDVLAWLRTQRGRPAAEVPPQFVLMEHLRGVEIGIGGFFDGHRFLEPLCLDWEHKRFFPGNLGELTGEMGTVVTYRGYERLFAATLAKLVESLRDGGYIGYINLNTIIDERGIWPLEFTTRFGYPGFAVCGALQIDGWDRIFDRMLAPDDLPAFSKRFQTHAGWSVGVVLTVPPFPYEEGYEKFSKGAPIYFRSPLTDAERDALYFGEVAMTGSTGDRQLVTDGSLGYLMVATGRGESIRMAQKAAYTLARQVVVRNLRYRNDIGDDLVTADLDRLTRLGWIG